ncbi:hypothetical protein KIPB_006051, partial [Kipferlia bialata]|eukprot:g6051.t1
MRFTFQDYINILLLNAPHGVSHDEWAPEQVAIFKQGVLNTELFNGELGDDPLQPSTLVALLHYARSLVFESICTTYGNMDTLVRDIDDEEAQATAREVLAQFATMGAGMAGCPVPQEEEEESSSETSSEDSGEKGSETQSEEEEQPEAEAEAEAEGEGEEEEEEEGEEGEEESDEELPEFLFDEA